MTSIGNLAIRAQLSAVHRSIAATQQAAAELAAARYGAAGRAPAPTAPGPAPTTTGGTGS